MHKRTGLSGNRHGGTHDQYLQDRNQGGPGMKLRSPQIAILSFLFVFGGILISMLAGAWQSESSKIPAAYTSGEFEGDYNPADIRGSYTFSDIAEAFGVPADMLVEAFGFKERENAEELQIKLFEDVYGIIDGKEIGTDSMRLFVALYLERPYTPEESTGLPARAIEILREKNKIDQERAATLTDKYSVAITGIAVDEAVESLEAAESAEEYAEDPTIKGKTTFRDLMDWGLTKAEIEEIIEMPIGPPTQALRDFFLEQGVEFSEYKEELQSRIDENQ